MSFTINIVTPVVEEVAGRIDLLEADASGLNVVSNQLFEGADGVQDHHDALVAALHTLQADLGEELRLLTTAVNTLRDAFVEADRQVASWFDGASLSPGEVG